jgi:hypothetical protein
MIDKPATVASLMEQLHGQLPMPAFPTKELVRTLQRRGVKASVDRALTIRRVFYAGDASTHCSESPTLPLHPGVSKRASQTP